MFLRANGGPKLDEGKMGPACLGQNFHLMYKDGGHNATATTMRLRISVIEERIVLSPSIGYMI